MRLVATADLHLGHRAFMRTTDGLRSEVGLNQVEADISRVFDELISTFIGLEPDLVCIAGDLFDKSRPSNLAIRTAMHGFRRLTQALPHAIVVVAAGNHDQPKENDGSILPLLTGLGIHIAERQARRLTFPDRELAILLVPDSATVALEPDPAYRHNVLVLHGGLEDVTPKAARGGRDRLTAKDLHAEKWSVVVLGDYHVFRSFAPNCFYTGAISYSSSNKWGEVAEERAAGLPGKGFIEFDLTTCARTFHPLTPARPVYDLPPIDATGLDAAAVSAALEANVARIAIDGAIVRQVVINCPATLAQEIDHAARRSYRSRALHYQLDTRRPERSMKHLAQIAALKEMAKQRLSLEEVVTVRAREHAAKVQDFTAEDRATFVATMLDYYHQAEDSESSKAAPSEAPSIPERHSEAA